MIRGLIEDRVEKTGQRIFRIGMLIYCIPFILKTGATQGTAMTLDLGCKVFKCTSHRAMFTLGKIVTDRVGTM